MTIIRWMCGVKITDMFTCNELRQHGDGAGNTVEEHPSFFSLIQQC